MNALLLFTLLTAAPPPAPPPLPPPPPPPSNDCYPTCRAGYFCSAGQCVSVCNPPCAAGETCTPTGECVAGTGAPRAAAPLEPAGPVVNSEGEHAPYGKHWELKRTRSLITAGAVTAGVAYIISVISGVVAYDFANIFNASARDEPLYLMYLIPIVGPVAGRAMLAATYGRNLSQAIDWLWAAVLSACQVGGLTMFVLGMRETEQLVSDDPRVARASSEVPVRWSLGPGAAGSPVGLTFTLRH